MIDKDEVPITVSIHRVSVAPGPKEHSLVAMQTLSLPKTKTCTMQNKQKKKTSAEVGKDMTSSTKYAVDNLGDTKAMA